MTYEYNRHAKKEKRNPKEIGIHSIRGGTVVGTHSVMFYGEDESFEITHTCTSRSIFANGALKAAEFIIKKDVGLYNMNDMVN
jgi:4-hydroxy-tetrahydrodipicolinate reductase